MRRLLETIWRLYPPHFRTRFGAEMERHLATTIERGGRVTLRMVADALATLLRAWGSATRATLVPEHVLADGRLALRALRRSPGYALTVVAILALALGANTAVFSVTHAVLLDALPYGAPDRVYEISPTPLGVVDGEWRVSRAFEELPQVEAAALYVDGGGANLATGATTERITLAQVSEDFFRVVAVQPLLGRGLGGLERADLVVLSHRLWVRGFGADAGVLGTRIDLNGRPYEVVGVMPADVEYPARVDVWLPMPTEMDFYGGASRPEAIALVAEGADLAALRAVLEQRLAERYAAADGAPTPPPVRIDALREALSGSVRVPLLVLLGIAGLVVLLGCLNLAGLVLSRTSARMHELTIRRALGAGRRRLFAQLLAEVLLLAVCAGAAGLAAASLSTGLLTALLPPEVPGLAQAGLKPAVLFFAATLAVCAGLLVGMVPSLHGAWAGSAPAPSARSPAIALARAHRRSSSWDR